MWDVTGGRVVAQRCVGIVSYLTATMCLVLLSPLPWYPTCVVVPVIVVVMVAEQVAMRTVVQVVSLVQSAALLRRPEGQRAMLHPMAPIQVRQSPLTVLYISGPVCTCRAAQAARCRGHDELMTSPYGRVSVGKPLPLLYPIRAAAQGCGEGGSGTAGNVTTYCAAK